MKKGTKRSNSTSNLVREYAGANPGISQSQIVKDLVAKGHKVYPALVSQALRNEGGKPKTAKPGAKKRGRPPKAIATVATATGAGFDFSAIEAAAKFVRDAGSLESATAAFATYIKVSKLFN